jgi:hypothetical protein
MQTVEAEGRKFEVIRTLNLEKFRDQQHADSFLKGKVYLRQKDSNTILLVNEILDVSFEDIVSMEPTQIPQQSVTQSQAEQSYTQEPVPPTGENVDIKL